MTLTPAALKTILPTGRRQPALAEYSVWQFFTDGTSECVRDHVGAEAAVKAAKHYTGSVAVQMGMIEKVIITDGVDCTCFEWKPGLGVTFK